MRGAARFGNGAADDLVVDMIGEIVRAECGVQTLAVRSRMVNAVW
jgi:hypothetical protein